MSARRWKILLVDDDEDAFVLTRDLLDDAMLGRFELDWVPSYVAAAEAVNRDQHDVYLVDYHLGERTGLELLRETHGNGLRAPVILLTGRGDRDVDFEAMEAGAADYLIKDQIDAALLERSIRYAVERHRTLTELQTLRMREKQEAENALAQYRALLAREPSPITAHLVGVGPLKEREPETLPDLITDYASLLDAYLECLGFHKPAPHRDLERFSQRLGDQGAGPRDVVDIHLRAVESRCRGASSKRARSYALEGRLLALEVMGHLVDYYRQGRGVAKAVSQEAEG